jgi:hypothetical protein
MLKLNLLENDVMIKFNFICRNNFFVYPGFALQAAEMWPLLRVLALFYVLLVERFASESHSWLSLAPLFVASLVTSRSKTRFRTPLGVLKLAKGCRGRFLVP